MKVELNNTNPPKNREFLGLVDRGHASYWDFFWWATRADGVNGKSCFVDRQFYDMPKLVGWIEVPAYE